MIPCTFRQLEIFVAAAEDCHFARTANRLGISQPAVTHHIQALERRLGKSLFVRRRGATPVLSTDGAAFLSQSRQMLEMGESIRSFGAAHEEKPLSRVRLVAGVHIMEDCIKPRLHEFYQRHPDILIECFQISDFDSGYRMVRMAEADLLVLAAPSPTAPGMHADLIRVIRFGLYASPAFAQWKSATASGISKLPFVMRIPGTPIDAIVQQALRQADIWPENVAARAQFNQVAVNLACQGAGIAPLFDTMVEEEMGRGQLIKFDLELAPRFRTMFRLEREPSPAMRAASAFLREIL